ncbi:MAG TPA: hypothetical protein VF559_07505 [Caulobacteraceae bacterium]|jgi:hypothetical protein
MYSYLDLRGASGACYRFRPASEVKTPMSGGFVYIRNGGDGCQLIYASAAENLLTDPPSRWSEAVSRYGATDIFLRLNVSRTARNQEMADIAEAHQPPMNAVTADAMG